MLPHDLKNDAGTMKHSVLNEIRSPVLLYTKGLTFLFLGVLATVLLIIRTPQIYSVALHLIAIWAFCRAYYFAFYVIQHYIDPSYRFAGLFSFAMYLVSDRLKTNHNEDEQTNNVT